MWLPNVETMHLEPFQEEWHQINYTVLSHCWGDQEVTFQNINSGNSEHLAGYRKILACCKRTRLEQYKHTWIDTCCINKTSSSELSEAISSMFLWYEGAAICYAYLEGMDWTWTTSCTC